MAHPDGSDSLGQLNFRLYYGEVLREALQRARDGVLDPQWRDKITTSSRLAALQANDPYGVCLPVVTAINEMPPAAWEPGHSPGWRLALDSWFQAARAALTEHRSIELEQHAKLSNLDAAVWARLTAPSAAGTLAQVADLNARKDDLARKSLSTFITQRDTLTASYGAALAAGGEDVDWRSWFEERISTWDNSVATNGARMVVRQRNSYLERLPAYW